MAAKEEETHILKEKGKRENHTDEKAVMYIRSDPYAVPKIHKSIPNTDPEV